jgi:hypothetical protein
VSFSHREKVALSAQEFGHFAAEFCAEILDKPSSRPPKEGKLTYVSARGLVVGGPAKFRTQISPERHALSTAQPQK